MEHTSYSTAERPKIAATLPCLSTAGRRNGASLRAIGPLLLAVVGCGGVSSSCGCGNRRRSDADSQSPACRKHRTANVRTSEI
jgi:hypothetical protein